MAGLVPAIHALLVAQSLKTWMPGTRPGMTAPRQLQALASIPDQIAQQARRHRQLRQRQPRAGDLVHGRADAVDLRLARLDPCLDRGRTGGAVADHLRREAALGGADRVKRAVERKAIEI